MTTARHYFTKILTKRSEIYGVLAIWVMLFHIANRIGVPGTPGIITPLVNMGNVAVDVFLLLSGYCVYESWKKDPKVIYLPRTEGVSSSMIRTDKRQIRLGFVGDHETRILTKFYNECKYVNGIEVAGICAGDESIRGVLKDDALYVTQEFGDLLDRCDAVFILSHPSEHYSLVFKALERGKHVLCEAPIALSGAEFKELKKVARAHSAVLMDSIKTAYSTAYYRLLLLVKSGKIGDVVSISATCTSIQELTDQSWNSICSWGPTGLLPVFQLLGTDPTEVGIVSKLSKENKDFDLFSRINLLYPHGIGEVTVGRGVKSEGELVISGTNGYIYVPAPWWKTEYFEVRYENPTENQRYFYQLEGEGIRYELVDFVKTIQEGKESAYISSDVSEQICEVMHKFFTKDVVKVI